MKYLVLSLVIFLHANNCAFPQTTSLSVAEWAKKLADPPTNKTDGIG
jgi:hypothetical protein